MSEIWKSVVGYEGKYEVSDFGRVRSLWCGSRGGSFKRKMPLILSNIVNSGGGHLRSKLTANGKSFNLLVHRLVLEAFKGSCPEGMEGCHEDGDPTNNRNDNLRWDTHVENMKDSIRHGTSCRGEKSTFAKITEEKALEIKRKLAEPNRLSMPKIALELGVSATMVRNIKDKRSWAWVSI